MNNIPALANPSIPRTIVWSNEVIMDRSAVSPNFDMKITFTTIDYFNNSKYLLVQLVLVSNADLDSDLEKCPYPKCKLASPTNFITK